MDISQNAFLEEAHELLADLEEALMELESDPADMEIVGRVFRNMHTIKGSGAMFGFDAVAAFTHNVETVYDLIREAKLGVDSKLISLTLEACDQIKRLLADPDSQSAARGRLEAAFSSLIDSHGAHNAAGPVVKAQAAEACPATYRIRFKPHAELLKNGTNPVPLLDELREMGESLIMCHHDAVPGIQEIDELRCYLWWEIFLTTDQSRSAIQDVFLFVDDLSDISIEAIECGEQDQRLIGEILLERGDLAKDDLERILAEQKRIGEVMVNRGVVEPDALESALAEQAHLRKVQDRRNSASVRVASNKLDDLMDLVGELVIVQARLNQYSQGSRDTDLMAIAEEVERLSAELRDSTMSVRMLPIGTTFARFKRLVRDLSAELGKEILFETRGAETELDKNVIEKLGDPLVHLIRNSIDHGIEAPAVRQAAAKPARGTIRLSARHVGAFVHVCIQDDGKGLDLQTIRQKAVQKGLISADANLDDRATYDLIFQPGFSTAASVTNVSGRGVGMDVVARSIESLGGSIEVSSAVGQGTTITLKLPLTLAIIDGLLVQIDTEFFVLPLGNVVECIELSENDIEQNHGRNLARVREDLVPYIVLRDTFGVAGVVPAIQQIVICEMDEMRVGFVVDRVIGQHQTVIKSLGKTLKSVQGVSGATIMGDGSVALILDIGSLIQSAELDELQLTGS